MTLAKNNRQDMIRDIRRGGCRVGQESSLTGYKARITNNLLYIVSYFYIIYIILNINLLLLNIISLLMLSKLKELSFFISFKYIIRHKNKK